MSNRNKRVIDLTVGELLDALAENYTPTKETVEVMDLAKDSQQYVYGLAGIASLFGCSKTTAARIKRSGKIDAAITQVGSLIIVDAEKALKLAGRTNKQPYKRK